MQKVKVLVSFMLMCNSLSALSAFDMGEKVYIDSKEMDMSRDRFKIHVGHNKWIETTSVSRDNRGLYTLESNIIRSTLNSQSEYEQEWRCPYCFNWWPMGKRCKNDKCPSTFTEASMRAKS